MQKNVIITFVFALFITIFAVANAGKVPVNFIFAEVQISAALLILVSALLGAVIVYSLDALNKIKIKKAMEELENKNESLQKENELLSPEKKSTSTKDMEKTKDIKETVDKKNSKDKK